MSHVFSLTESQTFTVVHARHLAAKVATDLKRMQRLYGTPSDKRIAEFEGEVVELLRLGYLGTVTYGFQRNGEWIEPTLRYTAKDLASGLIDDDPGRIRPGLSVQGAAFHSYLTYSAAWYKLTTAQQQAVEANLPVQRTGAPEPQVSANSYFSDDKTYSAGGRALGRSSVRSF